MADVSHRDKYSVAVSTPPVDPPVEVGIPIIYMRPSAFLVQLPNISTNRAVITPGEFATWDDVFAAYPNVDDYLLDVSGGGDFTSMGMLTVNGMVGTAERYRTIRYFNPDDDHIHPSARVTAALVSGVRFHNNSAYWIVYGLDQVANNEGDNDVLSGSHHIVYSDFHVDQSLRQYGFRLRGGNSCVVQRCLLTDPNLASGAGLVALGITPVANAQTGHMLLDNEVRNWVDAFLVARNADDGFTETDWYSAGNDWYVTDAVYLPDGHASTENGADFKAASSSVQSVHYRDRMWGFRRRNPNTSESDATEIHREARNVRFNECIFSDAPFGMFETGWDAPTDPETPRNFIYNGCHFSLIRAYAVSTGAGSVFRVMNNLAVTNCWVRSCDYLLYVPGTLRAGGPTFTGNTIVETTIAHPSTASTPYVAANNTEIASATGVDFVAYQRKRFTGVELATSAQRVVDLVTPDLAPPVAGFTYQLTGGTVQITNTATTPAGSLAAIVYSWGDGEPNSTTSDPSHAYGANGIYSIRQTITDSEGQTDTILRSVQVSALSGPQLPIVRAIGTAASGTGAISPVSAGNEGDVELLIVESQGTQVPSLTVPADFAAVTNSPQDVGLASGSVLSVWWRRAPASPSTNSPTVGDPGDHLYGVILSIRQCVASGNPVNVSAGDFIASAALTVEIPGATTTEDNTLVVAIVTTPRDIVDPQFSNWANPSLANLTQWHNAGTTAGNGGGLGIVVGEKLTAGFYQPTTADVATLQRQARMSIAIRGQVA